MATQSGFRRGMVGLVAVAALAGGGWYWKQNRAPSPDSQAAGKPDAGVPGKSEGAPAGKADAGKKAGAGSDRNRPVPAVIDQVRKSDVPVLVTALGTVTARQQAVVRARVDGLLEGLTFREGALVQKGAPLARLDRRSFEAALASVQGQLAKDQAQLDIAMVDLQRYRKLLSEDSIASQQVDAQAALVKQLQGVLTADKAAVATARLNLSFTTVTAPISGRTGLRQVDPGNMVRASDANGIVMISEVQPISVVFSVPQESMSNVVAKFQEAERKGEVIKVQALDRDGRTPLEGGKLLAIDNQTDPTTGSTKLKAIFGNKSGALFPGQFVNVRMVVDTLGDALTVPQSAIQRGAVGTFVYVVTPEKTASVRKVVLGNTLGERIVVSDGLKEGESVVIDGADKLREGSPVTTVSPVPSAAGRRRGGAAGGAPGMGGGAGPGAAVSPGAAAPANPDSAPSASSGKGGATATGGAADAAAQAGDRPRRRPRPAGAEDAAGGDAPAASASRPVGAAIEADGTGTAGATRPGGGNWSGRRGDRGASGAAATGSDSSGPAATKP